MIALCGNAIFFFNIMEIIFIVLIVAAVVLFMWMSAKANKGHDPKKAKSSEPKDL
jgi:hypothetical protein